ERIDGGHLDAAAALFDRAVICIGGHDIDAAGLEALWRRTVRIHDDGTPRTKHVITNPQVTVDLAAGTAEARSYYTVLQAAPGLELRSEEHTSELQSRFDLVCRLLLEKKKYNEANAPLGDVHRER